MHDAPAFSVGTQAHDEEGLVNVVADPHFADNGFVYVTYTALTPHHHQRVSRFTMKGDTAAPDTEKVLIDGDSNSKAFHLGGALAFMADGTLLFGSGEFAGKNPQSLDSLAGKVLRINSDGSIPTDDPFFGQKSGFERSIWASDSATPTRCRPTSPVACSRATSAKTRRGDRTRSSGATTTAGRRARGRRRPRARPRRSSRMAAKAAAPSLAARFAADGGYLFMDYCKGTIRKFDPSTKAVSDVGVITGEGPSAIATSGTDFFYIERGLVLLGGGTGPGYDQGALYRRAG